MAKRLRQCIINACTDNFLGISQIPIDKLQTLDAVHEHSSRNATYPKISFNLNNQLLRYAIYVATINSFYTHTNLDLFISYEMVVIEHNALRGLEPCILLRYSVMAFSRVAGFCYKRSFVSAASD